MSEYVTHGATLKCTCGTAPSKLIATCNTLWSVQGNMMATTSDKIPLCNIMPFGTCKMKPTMGGFAPCVPSPTVWTNFQASMELPGGNPLLDNSTIQCTFGGLIKFQDSGQMRPDKMETEPTSPQIEALRKAAIGAYPFCEVCDSKDLKRGVTAIDVYWLEEGSEEPRYDLFPAHEVTLHIETIDYEPEEPFELDLFPPEGYKFKGGKEKITINDNVDADGIVRVENFKVEFDKTE